MNSANLRIILSSILLAIIGGALGALYQQYGSAETQANATVVGILGGLLIGLTLGMFWVHQQRRWVAAAVLLLLVALAFVFGGPLFAVLTGAAIVIMLFASASILRDLYGGDEWAAIGHHLNVWMSRRSGFVVVDSGKIIVPSSPGPHFGPNLVIIRPGNAVIMVSGPAITRICGPSIFRSKDFEYIDKVMMTQKRRKSMSLKDVLTRDQHPVEVSLTYIYGIGLSDETIQGHNGSSKLSDGSCGLTAAELVRLQQLMTHGPEWEQDVRAIVEGAVRNAIGAQDYTHLLRTSDYLALADQIQTRARGAVWQVGGDLQFVAVTAVSPRAEVLDAITEGERIRTRELAAGDGFRAAIISVAAGYRDAAKLDMSLEDIHREAARYMMEHMAADPATKVYFTNQGQTVLVDSSTPASPKAKP